MATITGCFPCAGLAQSLPAGYQIQTKGPRPIAGNQIRSVLDGCILTTWCS